MRGDAIPYCRLRNLRASVWILALVLLLGLYVLFSALFNPEMGLLPPSLSGGEWILAPIDIARVRDADREAIFSKQLVVPVVERIASACVRVSAARTYELRVNGDLVSEQEADPHRNWKFSRYFDFMPWLHGGMNVLEILVRNQQRPPALLVSGEIVLVSGERLPVISNVSWTVETLSRTKKLQPETVPPPRDFYTGHYLARKEQQTRIRHLETLAMFATYAAIATIVLVARLRRRTVAIRPSLRCTNHGIRRWLFAAVLIGIYFPMAIIRDPTEGWDAESHIEHIRYVAAGRGIPMPDEGWEMFQPPAYYWLAAFVYKAALPWSVRRAAQRELPPDFLALKAVQLLTPLFALIHVLIVRQFVSYVFRDRVHPHTYTFISLLPMQVYTSSFISNEVFSAVAISGALFLLVVNVRKRRFDITVSAGLGAAIGVACLSKYSGMLLAMTTSFIYAVLLLTQTENRRRLASSFAVVCLVFLVVAGPFYYRNVAKYGKPMPHNSEFVPEFTLEYFDLGFFISPFRVGLGAVDKFVSRASSFIDGNYSSMWLDNSHISHRWTPLFEAAIYFAAILPTFLIVLGFTRGIMAFRSLAPEYLSIGAMFVFAVSAYVVFILRFGSFEVVKAFYLLSQIGPLAVFYQLGCNVYSTGAKSSQLAGITRIVKCLYGIIAIYYLLVPLLIGKGL